MTSALGVWLEAEKLQVVNVAVLSKSRIIAFLVELGKSPALFARLREHFQRRDRLRLVIGYRRTYLESLVRQGEEEAGKIAREYRQESARKEQEYTETAAASVAHSGRPISSAFAPRP